MISFQFDNGSMLSNEGTTALNNKAVYEPSYKGKEGVLYFSKSAYISIPFEMEASEEVFVVSLSILISGEAKEDRMLFGGEGIPFSIRLRYVDGGFIAEACVDLKKKGERICRTDSILKPECWHELTFLLLDGEFFFIINGKAEARRVFAGNLFEGFNKPIAYVGKQLSKSVKGGFFGYLDSITFSNSLTDEQQSLWVSETEIGAGEIESKAEELADENIEVGKLINPYVFFSQSSSCHYSLYENGAIIWSPSYGSVWMRTELFQGYLNAFEKHLIGLPVDDEVYLEETNTAYSLCDSGGLFIHYVEGIDAISFFVPSDFLTTYLDSGFVTTFGHPMSQPIELSVENSCITYQLFDRVTLIKAEKTDVCGQVITISNDSGIIEEYLKNYSYYGLIKDYIEGYEGRDEELVPRDFEDRPQYDYHKRPVSGFFTGDYVKVYVKVTYLIAENAIISFINKTYEDKTTKNEFFKVDPDIFNYLKDNGGLDPVYKDPELNTIVPYGKYKYFTSPAMGTAKATIYHNCHKGVIAKYLRKGNTGNSKYDIRGFTEIKVYLCHINVGKIDDWDDENAETYIEVSTYKNSIQIVENQRWPDYSTRKHGKRDFDIIYEGKHVDAYHTGSVHYDFRIADGMDSIHLNIRPYDRDEYSDNDSLGCYDFYLDIDSGWGVYSNFLTDDDLVSFVPDFAGAYNTYNGVYLTESYGDNRGGRKNIKLDMKIEGRKVPYDLNENFRKYGYWSTENFKANTDISSDFFNGVFHASTGNWYDWILHFWDEVWLEVAKKSFSGRSGLCFGLSVEALLAIHGRSVYTLPLNNLNLYSEKKIQALADKGYAPSENGFDIIDSSKLPSTKASDPRYLEYSDEVKEGFFDSIRRRHLYQLGWEHVNYMIDKAIIGSLFEPKVAFPDIIHLLDRDGYCIVNLFGAFDGGHSVLAYGYDSNPKDGKIEKIYVADCNHPWWEDKANPNGSYLKINSDNLQVDLIYTEDNIECCAKKYDCCYGTPYHIITKSPRVPSWLEVTSMILRVIISIPIFAAANLTEFLYAICCSDDDISMESVNSDGVHDINLPVFEVKVPVNNAKGLRIFMTTSKNARLKVKKKNQNTDSYALHISNRGRTFRVSGNLREGECKTIDIRQGYKRKPLITLQSTKADQKGITRYSKSLTDSSFEVKEISSMDAYGKNSRPHNRVFKHFRGVSAKERYYLNLRPQRNKKYEVHSESCPFCKQIKNKEYIGTFYSAKEAIIVAREIKDTVDGCRFCCRDESTD